jgi:hypothetical protein
MVKTVWNIAIIMAALAFLIGLLTLWRLQAILRELFGDLLRSAAHLALYLAFCLFGVWRAFGSVRRHRPSQ